MCRRPRSLRRSSFRCRARSMNGSAAMPMKSYRSAKCCAACRPRRGSRTGRRQIPGPSRENEMAIRMNRRNAGVSASNAAAVKSYVLEDQVGFILRRVHQHATDVFSDVMGGFELTTTQFAALAKLHDLGPTSQNQLGRLIAMDPATMFGVAGRLVKRGLVRQSVD